MLPPPTGLRGGLATYRFPAASRAMPAALLSAVLSPAIVRIGMTSPLAPAANTTTPGARLKLVTESAPPPLTGLVGPSLQDRKSTTSELQSQSNLVCRLL